MKGSIAIVLALSILFGPMLPGLGVTELGKLPTLAGHYKKHQQLNSDIGILHFLEMHYADTAHHQQDHQEHHKLPFHDHQSPVSAAFVFFVMEKNYAFAAKLYTIGHTNQSVYKSIIEEDVAKHVWQPPWIS